MAPAIVTASPRLEGAELKVPTSLGELRITLHEFGLRLRSAEDARDYGILCGSTTALPVALRQQGEGESTASCLEATTADGHLLTLTIGHTPFAFELKRDGQRVQGSPTDGHFVRRFRLPPLARHAERWLLTLELGASTPVYGLGEKSGRLDKRGQLIRSYNRDALGLNAEWSYKNVPFAWSPEGWGSFVHTPQPVTHGVGYGPWSQRAYVLWLEDPALDVFIFTGTSGAEQLAQYTELTGRAPVPPAWSLGVILSKAYYKDAEEILAVAREVRRREMPCEVITFDGRAWQDTDTRFAFEWCPKRYPDPRPTIEALRALGFRICVWEYPLISVKNPRFAELAARGWLLRDARSGEAYRYAWDPEPFGAVLTQLPESGLLDFTHPEAYAWWRDQHRELFELGIDMIKADFGEQIEPHMLASDGSQGDALHNIYALLYNRCVYEAAEKYSRNGAFLFSRAGWSGSQRYPSQWGGDPQADWGGLAGNLRSGLSWGLTGAPFYATDVGGFYGDQRDPVLYVRWLQAAIFSAHLRLHGIGPREPWSYGPEAEGHAREALALRERLRPYLQRVVAEASRTGLPVQRPMVLACPDDRAAWAFEDQFFFGDDLLVAPCLERSGEVHVYLPAGEWRWLDDAQPIEGGRVHRLQLPLNRIAAFVRAGHPVA
ncbi:MAG: glycoside hydrolase family 31 protein [Sinobacteraceae bacterium]|nr:glycoside hydrolase family 31 protein [Nevskiaceae bacterium]